MASSVITKEATTQNYFPEWFLNLSVLIDTNVFSRTYDQQQWKHAFGISALTTRIDPNSQLLFYAIFAPQNLPKVKSAFEEELTRVRGEGYTATELDNARKALLEERRIGRAQDEDLVGQLVTQDYLGRTWDDALRVDRAIGGVSLDQANAALRKYLTPESMARVYAGDFAKK